MAEQLDSWQPSSASDRPMRSLTLPDHPGSHTNLLQMLLILIINDRLDYRRDTITQNVFRQIKDPKHPSRYLLPTAKCPKVKKV